jgi:hypothetical protein
MVDLMPSGRFLMEEFSYAGGIPAGSRCSDPTYLDVRTVTGYIGNTG